MSIVLGLLDTPSYILQYHFVSGWARYVLHYHIVSMWVKNVLQCNLVHGWARYVFIITFFWMSQLCTSVITLFWGDRSIYFSITLFLNELVMSFSVTLFLGDPGIYFRISNNLPPAWPNLATLEECCCSDIWPVPDAAVTDLCSPDDGCDGHRKRVENNFAVNRYLHTVASCWALLI